MGRTPKEIMLPSLEPVKDEALRNVLEQLFASLKENHRYYADDLTSTVITITDGDTTPDVQGGKVFKTANTGATSITTFDNAFVDQEITIIFGDANTTIATSGNIVLDSALTGATNGTVKLVYDGTNWREVTRSKPAGVFTLVTTNQIKFPASQSASADANTLDDYEEGTWTITAGMETSGTVTLDSDWNTGSYIKIGKMVTLIGYVKVASVSSPVGVLNFSVPFATQGPGGHPELVGSTGLFTNSVNHDGNVYAIAQIGVSRIRVYTCKDGAGYKSVIPAASDAFCFCVTYRATA